MATFLPYIAVAISAAGLGESMFGGGSKVNMPNVQSFTIPPQTVDALNSQISNETQLSSTAQQAAQSAIQQYSQGQLSAAYEGQYQAAYQQQLQAVQNQLAAQGFDSKSTQYQNAMAQFQSWAASQKSGMLQSQLNASLSEAGVSTAAISNINNIITTQSNVTNANNSAALGEGQLALEGNQVSNQNAAAIGTSAANTANTIGKLFPYSGGTTSNITGMTGVPNLGGVNVGSLLSTPSNIGTMTNPFTTPATTGDTLSNISSNITG
jgi:membrane-associated HD superfamily phosphohydrolase